MKLIKPSYEIIENYEVNGDKLAITKKELEDKFKEYRKLGYGNYNIDTYGCTRYHAMADVFMYLLELFEEN